MGVAQPSHRNPERGFRSPKDILPQDMQSGALGVTLRDASFLATLPESAALDVIHTNESTQIVVQPQLLKSGDELDLKFLVAGRPRVDALVHLPATRLVSTPPMSPEKQARFVAAGAAFTALTMLWLLNVAYAPAIIRFDLWLVVALTYAAMAYGMVALWQWVRRKWISRTTRDT